MKIYEILSAGRIPRPEPMAGLEVTYLPEQADDHEVADPLLPPPGALHAPMSKNEAVPAAYGAINLLVEQIAVLPRRVVMVAEDGTEEPQHDHPITHLLAFPSRMIDPQQCWRMVLRQLIAHGNGYLWIRRHRGGAPMELVPANSVRTEWITSRRTPYLRYDLELLGTNAAGGYGGRRVTNVFNGNVLAFHGPGYDGIRSPSPIRYAGRTMLSAMLNTVKRHENAVRKGVNSGNVLMPKEGSPMYNWDHWTMSAEKLQADLGRAEKAGKMILLAPGLEVGQLAALSALDLQLIEILRWGVEDVCRVFGVSPVRLGHFHEGMRARTFEQQAVDFERYSIMPRVVEIDSQLTRKLLNAEEIMAGYRVSTDCNSVGFGTLTERIGAADMAVARAGVWTINEGRAITGLPPHPDGDRLIEPKGAPSQQNGGDPGKGGNEHTE